jgi:hypothetical protein
MATLLKDLTIKEVSSVNLGAGEGVQILLMKREADIDAYLKREFSDEQRRHLAGTGAAMPGGGYPIENKGDLHNAIQAFGRAKDKAKTKAHIISRARSLGATDMLPDDWKVGKSILDHVGLAARALLKSAASIIGSKEPVDKKTEMLADTLGEFEDHLAKVVPDEIEKAIEAETLLSKGDDMTDEEKKKAEAEKAKKEKEKADCEKAVEEAEKALALAKKERRKADPDGKNEDEEDEEIKPVKEEKRKREKAEKRYAALAAILKLSPVHQDYLDANDWDEREKQNFLEKTPEERDEHMDKNPIAKGASLPDYVVVALAKAAANDKIIKALQEKDEITTFAKKASDLGMPEVFGETLRKAYKGDAAAIKKLEEAIKGLGEQVRTGKVFAEFGTTLPGADATAAAEMTAKAAELRKANPKLSEASAFTKAYTDPANIELKRRYDAEEAKKRANAA